MFLSAAALCREIHPPAAGIALSTAAGREKRERANLRRDGFAATACYSRARTADRMPGKLRDVFL